MQGTDHGWLPHGIDGTLTRGMEWVMYTAAGAPACCGRPGSHHRDVALDAVESDGAVRPQAFDLRLAFQLHAELG